MSSCVHSWSLVHCVCNGGFNYHITCGGKGFTMGPSGSQIRCCGSGTMRCGRCNGTGIEYKRCSKCGSKSFV
jgi:hypothetical protein